MRTSLGIIGFGRLGALLARHFSKDFAIRAWDRRNKKKEIRSLGAAPASLEKVCAQKVIVCCVPISQFESLVRRIQGLLHKDALVIDVCSVKEHPVRIMKSLLPKSVEILATHPNFGPDSASASLKGHKVIAHKVRISPRHYRKFRRVLERKGLEIVEMSPREHDRRMAQSLLLTHFIGRGLNEFGAKTTGVDTEGYKRLLAILQTVQNDSWQLLRDMNRYNAFAAPMRRKFLDSLRQIERKITR